MIALERKEKEITDKLKLFDRKIKQLNTFNKLREFFNRTIAISFLAIEKGKKLLK